jgi:hypothetical protein
VEVFDDDDEDNVNGGDGVDNVEIEENDKALAAFFLWYFVGGTRHS